MADDDTEAHGAASFELGREEAERRLRHHMTLGWRERADLPCNLFGWYEKEVYVLFLRAHGAHARPLAVRATGFCRMTVEKHLREDVKFREMADEACAEWRAELTEQLVSEARAGFEDAVYFKDQVVGKKRVVETQLRKVLLENDSQYSPKAELDVKHTGGVMVVPQALTRADYEAMFPPPEGAEAEDKKDDEEV